MVGFAVLVIVLSPSFEMVVFVDLEDESEPPELIGGNKHWSLHDHASVLKGLSLEAGLGTGKVQVAGRDANRNNPNKNALTEALGCYP